jgi:signal transduction histidine kinase
MTGHSFAATIFVPQSKLRPFSATTGLEPIGSIRQSGDLELEYRIQHPDGSIGWVLSGGHTYHDAEGISCVAPASASKRRSNADSMNRCGSRRRWRQSVSSGGVARDFNNLLTVIRSSVDLLKRPTLTEERRRRYIGAISDTVDRAAKLTAQLLAFSRRQALKPEVFYVGQSIEVILDMLHTLAGSRVQISVRTTDEACFVCTDRNQFGQDLSGFVFPTRGLRSNACGSQARHAVDRATSHPAGA